MVNNIFKRDTPDRGKINMNHRVEVKSWTRQLGISQPELQKVVYKVGNSASAVRKEPANRS